MSVCADGLWVKRSIISIMILMLAGVPFCSCSRTDKDELPAVTSGTGIEVPQDPADRYYLTDEFSLDIGDDSYRCGDEVLDTDDGKIAVFRRWDTTDNGTVCSYKISKHTDGTNEWNTVIDIEDAGVLLGGFCTIGNNRIAACTYYGFNVYDLNSGALVEQIDDLFVLTDDTIPMMYRRGDDLVIVKRDYVYLIGNDYSVKSRIPITEEEVCLAWNGFFTRGGRDFLVYSVGNSTILQYYEVDFDRETFTYCCSSGDLGTEGDTDEICGTGGYVIDDNTGIIYELDPGNRTKREIAYIDNMLIRPSLSLGFDPMWFVFGENDYGILYGNDNAPSDFAILIPDTASNLVNRTRLYVRGYTARGDDILEHAAYKYNTSQDKFLITVENFENNGYGYLDPAKAQEVKLSLIKDFVSGNAPDIFYGHEFDYDQMGRSGLVMDLTDLLKDSKTVNKDTISRNIYDIFCEDGHCYKVFAGYVLDGYWSNSKFTGGNDNMTLDDLLASDYSPSLFGDEYAYAIADYAIRYPLDRLIDNGEFISEEDLEKIIQFAIDNGIGPYSQNSFFLDLSVIDSKQISLVRRGVGFVSTFMSHQYYMKDELKYVGYPTLNGSAHVAYPCELLAVSADTKYPEECKKFIEILFSDEIQKTLLIQNEIPVKKAIFDEGLEISQDRSKIGDDKYYRIAFGNPEYSEEEDNSLKYTEELIESYRRAVGTVDTIEVIDWGLYDIIKEEINSYYLQKKDVKEIAHSMRSRIVLYIEENYK